MSYFGQKMSDVQPLFQALILEMILPLYSYTTNISVMVHKNVLQLN